MEGGGQIEIPEWKCRGGGDGEKALEEAEGLKPQIENSGEERMRRGGQRDGGEIEIAD